MTQSAAWSEVGLSCVDLFETDRWFGDVLGLPHRGGARRDVALPEPNPMTGEPRTQAICWWLDTGPASPPLALYQFSDPVPVLMEHEIDERRAGIHRLDFHVADFDAVLARLPGARTLLVGVIQGGRGSRRASVRTPDGIVIQLLEADPLSGAPAAPGGATLRRVVIGTRDLAATQRLLAPLATSEGCRLDLVEVPEAAVAPDDAVPGQGGFRLEFAGVPATTARALGAGDDSLAAVPGSGPVLALRDPGSDTRVALVDGPASAPAGPSEERPLPAAHQVRTQLIIEAPADVVWHALNDHDRILQWLKAERLDITVAGRPYASGYGAVRVLTTFGRHVQQQITRIAPHFIGYRAIGGTPFRYHNGTVDVIPKGDITDVIWTIRFDTYDAPTGVDLQPRLQAGIDEQQAKLKAMIEADMRLA